MAGLAPSLHVQSPVGEFAHPFAERLQADEEQALLTPTGRPDHIFQTQSTGDALREHFSTLQNAAKSAATAAGNAVASVRRYLPRPPTLAEAAVLVLLGGSGAAGWFGRGLASSRCLPEPVPAAPAPAPMPPHAAAPAPGFNPFPTPPVPKTMDDEIAECRAPNSSYHRVGNFAVQPEIEGDFDIFLKTYGNTAAVKTLQNYHRPGENDPVCIVEWKNARNPLNSGWISDLLSLLWAPRAKIAYSDPKAPNGTRVDSSLELALHEIHHGSLHVANPLGEKVAEVLPHPATQNMNEFLAISKTNADQEKVYGVPGTRIDHISQGAVALDVTDRSLHNVSVPVTPYLEEIGSLYNRSYLMDYSKPLGLTRFQQFDMGRVGLDIIGAEYYDKIDDAAFEKMIATHKEGRDIIDAYIALKGKAPSPELAQRLSAYEDRAVGLIESYKTLTPPPVRATVSRPYLGRP